MLQLLQPIWLFALGALAAPVLIHLWNDRKGKTLAIGSIHFLEKESRRQSRSLRISEWLLLILRCLLLAALALLLAGPVLRSLPAISRKGWVLVGDSITATSRRATIDSLVEAGYLRKDMAGNGRPNWWASFDSLDAQAAPGLPFYVFTDARAVHFNGDRPVTERAVHWVVNTDSSVSQKIVKAWRLKDSIILRTLESRATGSLYHDKADDPEDVKHVKIDTAPLRVEIAADAAHLQDARYVAAAIQALQKFTRRNINISDRPFRDIQPDWLFSLSAKPVSTDAAKHLLIYAAGKETPIDSRISQPDITLSRRTTDTTYALPIWTDGFGTPLLTVDSSHVYRLYTHFDPSWNGLVWSREFPAILAKLIIPEERPEEDLTVLDPLQIQPAKGRRKDPILKSKETVVGIDLGPACWILILVLLVAERIIANRTKNKLIG